LESEVIIRIKYMHMGIEMKIEECAIRRNKESILLV